MCVNENVKCEACQFSSKFWQDPDGTFLARCLPLFPHSNMISTSLLLGSLQSPNAATEYSQHPKPGSHCQVNNIECGVQPRLLLLSFTRVHMQFPAFVSNLNAVTPPHKFPFCCTLFWLMGTVFSLPGGFVEKNLFFFFLLSYIKSMFSLKM